MPILMFEIVLTRIAKQTIVFVEQFIIKYRYKQFILVISVTVTLYEFCVNVS